jgi:arylsulfatase A-like enzyme
MKIKWTLFFLTALGWVLPGQAQNPASAPPNVIFIYADDLGYGDLSCYGADSIHTPYLDQMAAEGIRFTNFYVTSPVCSPSRTGLLTGRYQVRSGVTRVFFPNSLQGIDSTEYTMAEMFRDAGYATGIIGKWHLGHLPPFLPMAHGFDYWFGIPYSNDMEWKPRKDPPLPLMRNGKIISQPAHQPTLTQRYTTEAINFIARHREQPFFLYIPHTFPHKPLHVSAEYAGTSPYGKYGDVVQELDRSVGDVLEALSAFGIAENTLVVFSSDNGPAAKGGGKTGGLRGHKATTYEGGIKVPALAWWPGKIKPAQDIAEPLLMTDWLPTFAQLAGSALPEGRPCDGRDISEWLFDKGQPQSRDFFFYFNEHLRTIRSGDWKYMRPVLNNPYRQHLEPHGPMLFNLAKDPNETTNLIEDFPEKARELEQRMAAFEHQIQPVPEPKLKAVPFDDPRNK